MRLPDRGVPYPTSGFRPRALRLLNLLPGARRPQALHQPPADSERRHLDARIDSELGKQTGDVRLDGARADLQSGAYLTIREAGYEEAQDVDLARREHA